MKSHINLNLAKAIVADREFVEKMSSLAAEFSAAAIGKMVGDSGLDPTAIRTSEDINRVISDDKRNDLFTLMSNVRDIESPRWNVELKSGQHLTQIKTEELLSLDNVGQGEIVSIEVKTGLFSPAFEARVDREFYRSGRITVRSEDAVVRDFSRKAQSIFEASSPSWSVARNPLLRFLLMLFGWAALLFVFTVTAATTFSGTWQVVALVISSILAILTVYCCNWVWGSAFPNAEFIIGGGKERAAARGGLRKFLIWTVPTTFVILPLLRLIF